MKSRSLDTQIKNYINDLVDQGVRGNTNSYKGMTQSDESHLTGLLMQAAKPADLDSIHDLDRHDVIFNLIAVYCKSNDTDDALAIANHLKDLYVKCFQPKIQYLMEDSSYDRPDVSIPRVQLDREIERDRYRGR